MFLKTVEMRVTGLACWIDKVMEYRLIVHSALVVLSPERTQVLLVWPLVRSGSIDASCLSISTDSS